VKRLAHGRLAFLILHSGGVVKEYNQEMITELESLNSFMSIELFSKVGATLRKTVDCFTFGGILCLLNKDEHVMQSDYDRIREIEEVGFVVFEE
jgi:hypothetical protein